MLLLLVYICMFLISVAYFLYGCGVWSVDTCSAVALLCLLSSLPPLLYHMLVSLLSALSAASCPMTSTEEILEKGRCNVQLGLRGPKDAWLLLVPARCDLPVTDVFVHSIPGVLDTEVFLTQPLTHEKPRLEFPVLDYLATQHRLEPPLAVLFGPVLPRDEGTQQTGPRYLSEMLYSDEEPVALIAAFLRSQPDAAYEHCGPQLLRELMALLQRRARAGHVLVVTLVNGRRPPALEWSGADDDGDSFHGAESDEERMGLLRYNAKP